MLHNSMDSFTRSQINKAGDTLISNDQDSDAAEILEFWRSVHFVPMNKVRDFLWKCVESVPLQCNGEISFSCRLKRAESVIHKLERYPTMTLSKMYDLAGIRYRKYP
jgi:hypothetical protein